MLLANLIWPSLLLGGRMMAWVPIVAGLIIEYFFLRYTTRLRGFLCAYVDVSMNMVSALLGIILIPLSGLGWEVVAGVTVHPFLKVGTFNPVSWVASILIAAFLNAVIEGFVLRRGFDISLGRRGFWLLAAANLVTVTIAYISILTNPPEV